MRATSGGQANIQLELSIMVQFQLRGFGSEVVPHVQEPYPAEKARGGEIILNTPARRAVVLAGLVPLFS